jgi:hypothetical protein
MLKKGNLDVNLLSQKFQYCARRLVLLCTNVETSGREMRKQDEITKYVLLYLIILDHIALPDFSQIRKMLQQMNGIAEDGLVECTNCRSLAFQTSHPSFLSLEL